MAYLVFAKAGTAWSVRPIPGRPPVPWWPQLLMMSQLSVLYFFSALSKINVWFISGIPLAYWVWIELPWQLYAVAAVMTIVVELTIAVASGSKPPGGSQSSLAWGCTFPSSC